MVSRASFQSWKCNNLDFFKMDFCYMYFKVLEEELLKYSQKKGSYFLVEYERHDLRLIPGCIEVYGRISTEALCGSSFPLMTSGWYTVQLSLRVH